MKRSIWTCGGLALALCCAGIGSSPGFAAEPAYISSIGGDNVSVMRGAKPLPVRAQMLLSAGERVKAGLNSFVEIRYLSDGCTLMVESGRSFVIGNASPCAATRKAEGADLQQPPAKVDDQAAAAAPKGGVIARVTGKSGPLTRANFGNGLVDLEAGAELKAGHTVFAGQGSTITVYYYGADCEQGVPAETYLEISEAAPCRTARKPDDPENAVAANADVGLAIGAAAVLGGGAALAVLLLTEEEEDEDRPVTPD